MAAHKRTLSATLGSRELAIFEAFALRNFPITAPDVCRFSGVSWATTHRKLRDWEAQGLLEAVDKDGKAVKYQLNLKSPTVKTLAKTVRLGLRELLESDLLAEGFTPLDLGKPDEVIALHKKRAGELGWIQPSAHVAGAKLHCAPMHGVGAA